MNGLTRCPVFLDGLVQRGFVVRPAIVLVLVAVFGDTDAPAALNPEL